MLEKMLFFKSICKEQMAQNKTKVNKKEDFQSSTLFSAVLLGGGLEATLRAYCDFHSGLVCLDWVSDAWHAVSVMDGPEWITLPVIPGLKTRKKRFSPCCGPISTGL